MSYLDQSANSRGTLNFVRHAMSTPLLTREREQELALRWRDQKDEVALHELVNAYTRLVAATAAKYRNYGLPMADLMQEGAVGLMQAAARFEPEREVRFSTYASWWIRSAMQDYLLRNWSIVRTGSTSSQKSLFFNLRRLRARIEGRTGKPLDDQGREWIATELNVAKNDVESMEGRLTGADRSLDAPVGEDGDETWVHFLADQRPSPEDNAMAHLDGDERARWIRQALAELPEREERIIRQRLLEDDSRTLESLGQELGVSKERVRQLEARALTKLRRSLAPRWHADGNALSDT
ncbi:MAG: RNA polymerase factor sigma-32 [Alphaproteobacteria bacterium]|nr:RNA polymerase factor sigma-32 [Alphaproteobacteria bacterium]MCY4320093.1 RNA polymerase factor sigma-32 [Alphaproteobacteria bacterium]